MSSILIYTDGACSGNPGPGGFGAIVTDMTAVYELGEHEPSTTNNRMEMMAVIRALELVQDQFQNSTEVVIYTDSVYVIRGITQWIWGWKKRGWKTAEGAEVTNKDLWLRMEKAVTGFKIKWNFIRGHKGILGNERCDEIAVSFSKRTSIDLYQGSIQNYYFDLKKLPTPEDLPEMKGSSSSAEKKESWYLSLIAGKVQKYKTWKECEAAVKGRPGVKFKKVSSQQEEDDLLSAWKG